MAAERWEAGDGPEGPPPEPEDNITQHEDTSCVWASLANIDQYALGYTQTTSEADIMQKARDLGINTRRRIQMGDARKAMETMGYRVFQRQNAEDIAKELQSGKGLIVYHNRHATAIHLDKYGRLIRRDPLKSEPQVVEKADEDIVREWLGVSERKEEKEANPYGHVLIIGKIGSKPVTGPGGEIDPVAKARMETEQRIRKKESFEDPKYRQQRLAYLWNRYRPHMEVEGEHTMGGIVKAYNRGLDKAYQHQLKEVEAMSPDRAEQELNRIESRLLTERIILSENTDRVKASDATYKKFIDDEIKRWEDAEINFAYTKAEKKNRSEAVEQLKKLRKQFEEGVPGGTPNIGSYGKAGDTVDLLGFRQKTSARMMEQHPKQAKIPVWPTVAELRIEYYTLNPSALIADIVLEDKIIDSDRDSFDAVFDWGIRGVGRVHGTEYDAAQDMAEIVNEYTDHTGEMITQLQGIRGAASGTTNPTALSQQARRFLKFQEDHTLLRHRVFSSIEKFGKKYSDSFKAEPPENFEEIPERFTKTDRLINTGRAVPSAPGSRIEQIDNLDPLEEVIINRLQEHYDLMFGIHQMAAGHGRGVQRSVSEMADRVAKIEFLLRGDLGVLGNAAREAFIERLQSENPRLGDSLREIMDRLGPLPSKLQE